MKEVTTEADYQAALVEIERLFNCTPGTAEEKQRNGLVDQVEAYEAEHYPIGPPTVAAALEYEADKRGLVALSNEERDAFLQLLASDEEPNDALAAAAREYTERHAKS